MARCFMWIFKVSLLVANMLVISNALAQAIGVRTNINQVTDLFDKEIEGKDELEELLKQAKQQAALGVENKSAMQELPISETEAENTASQLNNINANDLAIKGQSERNKEEHRYFDLLEVDYSSPNLVEHRKDIDLISSASSKLITRLIAGLKDLDIDCQEVKGNQEREAEYYLDIKKEVTKDTIYDQVFCEQLRNNYSCREQLIMSCKRQGMIWQPWQDRTIVLSGDEISNLYRDWFYSVFLKKHRSFGRRKTVYSLHIRNNSSVIGAVRVVIAGKLGVTLEHIDQSVVIPYQGEGNLTQGWDGDIVKWDRYIFYYKYRDGHLACLEWQEEWSEQCLLN